ncbi:MAG TPA: DinB family protein [Vicinamibacterales bacterium]|nr:DinB family protein [Vicinamibacterales bacterium]
MMIAALQFQLRSLRRQIEHLPASVYAGATVRSSGSVGQHVRHIADHARSLLALGTESDFSYDARLRGTRVETDPVCAADELVHLCVALEDLDDLPFDRQVRLHIVTEPGRASAEVMTTLGREIAFVIQHTIHHCALIAVLLDRAGVAVPERFGVAPSTPVRA